MPALSQIRTSDLWQWLPAFRAVAESEHLPTAAQRMHVTPSALSRSVRQLEEHLEQRLFNRVGRSLVLNAAGQQLLAAVQQAMGAVDAGLRDVLADPFAGELRVSTIGVLTNHYVLDAVLALTKAHPRLLPRMSNLHAVGALDALVTGGLDAAFFYESLSRPGLAVERLGHVTNSIYCGRTHPLFDAPAPSLSEILEHPFSIPQIGDTGGVLDGWPIEVKRRVGLEISLLTTNLEVVRRGGFVAVLPDVVALPDVRSGALRRLSSEVIPPTPIYVARRESESDRGAVAELLAGVRARIAQVDRDVDLEVGPRRR